MTKIRWTYLPQKFPQDEVAAIFTKMLPIIAGGNFTLGQPVAEFETAFAAKLGVKHAIGVASGTDAIKLGLKACGIKAGDEVITAANTFIATAGAICELGAIPVFVDVTDNFCIDHTKIEAAITDKTRAIVPVHLTGQMAYMPEILNIAAKHNLIVVEDACQCFMGEQTVMDGIYDKRAGTWGALGAFSLHPLKNLSVWGDGGMIVTNDDAHAEWLRLYRNHGLKNRDEVEIMGCNSRLDTLQAIIGIHLIDKIEWITDTRIAHADFMDKALAQIPQIKIPQRFGQERKITHQLYIIFAEKRDELFNFLKEKQIEAKIHYPVPCYRQKPFHDRYRLGDFPVTDRHAETMISLPAHEHLHEDELQYIVDSIRSFYEV